MLRVLLADDEKLVRKSLISLFPWKDYDMEVAGEAGTGEDALKWLEHNRADIIFVDLGMPVLDGFGLLRQINQKYPDMVKVVLTCCAEVKRIQQAIEEGIAGYILKSDFDMEDIRRLLERVRNLALRNQSQGKFRGLLISEESLEINSDANPGQGTLILNSHYALVSSEHFCTDPAADPSRTTVFIRLNEEQFHEIQMFPQKAEELCKRQLFYTREEDTGVYEPIPLPTLAHEALASFEQQIGEGKWLLNNDEYHLLCERLAGQFCPSDILLQALDLLHDDIGHLFTDPLWQAIRNELGHRTLSQWSEVQKLMDLMKTEFTGQIRQTGLNAESAAVILRALYRIRDPKKLFGKADDIASDVGFSRSYFSRCFSRMMKMSYRDYTDRMRIRWIRQKMDQDGMSMSEIAMSLDYINAAYFCRVYNIKLTKQ